jgi:hypothetical protein
MKALSGYAEWFYCLAKNWKPVENRGWSLTRYFRREQLPVTIYLHASKTKTPIDEYNFITRTLTSAQYEEFRRVDFDKLRGTLFAKIKVIDEITTADCGVPEYRSVWFFGPFGFITRDGEFLATPIPCKGHTFFFTPEVQVLK